MKKSTILTCATVGAVIATAAGTYAAWDTTEALNTGALSIENPVTISSTNAANYSASSRTLGEAPTYSSEVVFDVDKQGQTVSKLSIEGIAVYADEDADKATDLASNFTITVAGTAGDSGVTVTGATLVDTSVEASNTYTVTLTPKDDTVKGKDYKVDVKAKIE